MGRVSLFQAAILSARAACQGIKAVNSCSTDWHQQAEVARCRLHLLCCPSLPGYSKLEPTFVDVKHNHFNLRALEGDHGHGWLQHKQAQHMTGACHASDRREDKDATTGTSGDLPGLIQSMLACSRAIGTKAGSSCVQFDQGCISADRPPTPPT